MNRIFVLSGTLVMLASVALAQSKPDPNLHSRSSRKDPGTAKVQKVTGVPRHRATSPRAEVTANSKPNNVANELSRLERETAKTESSKPTGKNPSLPAASKVKPAPASGRNAAINFSSQSPKTGSRTSRTGKASGRSGAGIGGRVKNH